MIRIILFVDFVAILILFLYFDKIYILNTQVAFGSLCLVVFASYKSYKNNINNQIKTNNTNMPDKIDKIDDPYDLYSNTNIEIKKPKQNNIKNLSNSITAFASIYRILSYMVLIFGFYLLNTNHILNPIAYLIGLSILPFGILTYMATNITKRKNI